MSEYERQQQIMNILYQKQSLSTDELIKIFHVSPATIRRDLRKLADKGLVMRYKGGASLPKIGFGHEPPLAERESKNLRAKRAIGEAASRLIKDGEVIALDVGTTCMELAKAIRNHRNITVFTYSLPIAYKLSNSKVNVYLVGGLLKPKEMCLSGPVARNTISQFHFDKFFLGAAGITEKEGITDFGMDEVEIKRSFIERSNEVITLVDSSKFGHVSFITICQLEKIKQIVTDEGIDPQILNNLRKKGVNITVVSGTEEEINKINKSHNKKEEV
ncbi:MAG: DeoR/GlpR transcriptional regulator [Firmicutes bacterium]|nr:DeoR/GlpR transcriptional regulator [Bacillota bacterium]